MNCPTLLAILAALAEAHGFCGSRSLDVSLVRAAVRAAEWLRSRQDENGAYGEGHTNGFVFHSLRLVGHSVETGAGVLRNHINKYGGLDEIAGGPLAVYILGAMATCRDPEQFYGLDLVTSLVKKVENYPQGSGFNHPFQYSLAIIALCASGKDIGQLKYLNNTIRNIPKQTAKAHASGDTLAMHIFALKCAQKFVKGEEKHKSLREIIQGAIDKASKLLLNRQQRDPTFHRNEVTAALSYLGMLAAEVNQENCSETMQWLLSRQNPDGSFQNLGATIYVMQSLVGAFPYDVKDITCPTTQSSDVTKDKMIRVCVKLKFNETHKYSNGRSVPAPVCVKVLNGTDAHDILKLAAKQNSCFSFHAVKTMWGHSVYGICGIERKPKEKFYWMIYINGKSAKTGIDYLKPSNGSTVLFAFKQLSWRK